VIICVFVSVRVRVCVCACVSVYSFVFVCLCFVCVYVRIFALVCVCLCVCVCLKRAGTLVKRWLRPTAAFLATLSAAVLVATMSGSSVSFSFDVSECQQSYSTSLCGVMVVMVVIVR